MRAASVTRTPLALRRMRRAEVRELVESVGMRFEAVRRNLSLGEEGETVIDDIVGKDAAVGVLGWFRGVIAQHVRQKPVGIDRGDRFFPGVMTGMPHQVDKLIEPAITVVDRLAGVVLLFGLVRVEEAADRGVAGAIDMAEPAIAKHTAAAPDANLGLGAELAGRQLQDDREHVAFGIRILAGPRRLARTIENTLLSVFESWPVHGDLPPR